MANAFYSKGVNAFLNGVINYGSDTIKASLDTTAYSPSLSGDQYHSTITSAGSTVAAGVALSSKTSALGVASAANVVFSSVTGSACAYIPIWKDTGTDSTSPLIALFDTATGLPVTPNGGDITIAWSSGNLFTLCQGLPESTKEPGLIKQLWEWLNDKLGIPVVRDAGGLLLPTPRLIVTPRLVLE